MKTKDGVESSGEPNRIVKSTYPNFFGCEIARLRMLLGARVLLSAFLLLGCPGTTQMITVTNNGSSLSVTGIGFSNIPQCARLALTGLGTVVPMGLANCSGGGFSNFNWRFSYTPNCQLTGRQDALVSASDETSSEIAFQKISIWGGPNFTSMVMPVRCARRSTVWRRVFGSTFSWSLMARHPSDRRETRT